ncbi:ABC transporter substrate-binding protein [Thermoleophilia bacterium SCSIO 60948]|nr:ABC transporter substrate-binding protein [Thermoleophilia bacterium SCSIO 60948]
MNRVRLAVLALLLAVLAGALVAIPAQAQDDGGGSSSDEVLRLGWAEEPRTMNPYVGQDEENYNVWAINWSFLVGLDPEDLSLAPGIASDWQVSEDRKTVSFEIDPDLNWSDGEPVTSKDVKFSLESLGTDGALFAGYTSSIEKIETPDPKTVVIKTKRPDARIVGGLNVYILPEHIWGKVPPEDLTGNYQPELPLVGTGPYVVTEFDRGRLLTMERNPEYDGPEPAYDEIQYIKYGSQDAAERALTLGEIDILPEVEAASFERLGEDENIETISSPIPGYTQLAFNLCSPEICPDNEVNPAIQDRDVRHAIAFSIDRDRLNEIASRGTSFVANGILPSFYKAFYTEPDETYAYDPDVANQILDEAGWEVGEDGVRERDGERLEFDLAVRSESPYTIQMARLIAEQGEEVGVKWNVDVVSTDRLYELTTATVDGNPAPDFDTFIWGWGGDAYDPSFLLSILTTDEIGASSDSFWSNPTYDDLYEQQLETFDTDERREIIAEMINIAQEDLPYLVLTEDPALQAYRTDSIEETGTVCPAEDGDLFCNQTSAAGLLNLTPATGASSSAEGTTAAPGLSGLVGLAIGFVGGALVFRRRGGGREPLELAE